MLQRPRRLKEVSPSAGQPAAVGCNRGADGAYRPSGVTVLSVTNEGVRQVRSFGDPRLVTVFGFGPDRP